MFFSKFSIGPASDFYRLTADGYTGNASDGLAAHSNMQFTTKDSDHDLNASKNCAILYEGAWWHRSCYNSHLNGLYAVANSSGVRWWLLEEPKSAMLLKFTEMKFREKI